MDVFARERGGSVGKYNGLLMSFEAEDLTTYMTVPSQIISSELIPRPVKEKVFETHLFLEQYLYYVRYHTY